jgi:PAS domain S-box-containing protein
MRLLRALTLAATSAAVSATATAALARRRISRAAPSPRPAPLPDAADVGGPDPRGEHIARLEQDLATMRSLLERYIVERETTEAELQARTEALHESEARYRLLIDRAAYGIYRASPDGRFLDVNPALVAMLGYESTDELLAVDMARDVYRDPAERDELLARIRANDSADWVDVRWTRKDGAPITVRLSARSSTPRSSPRT